MLGKLHDADLGSCREKQRSLTNGPGETVPAYGSLGRILGGEGTRSSDPIYRVKKSRSSRKKKEHRLNKKEGGLIAWSPDRPLGGPQVRKREKNKKENRMVGGTRKETQGRGETVAELIISFQGR